MIKSKMDYLDHKREVDILKLKNDQEQQPGMVLSKDAILEMRDEVMSIHTHPSILDYIESVTRATRDIEELDLGLSPRGAIHLLQTAKARAYIRGRSYVIPDDVKAMAHKVIDHRLILSPEAELSGVTKASMVDSILSTVPVPKGEFKSADDTKSE
jgi:MoxR-like ATPase